MAVPNRKALAIAQRLTAAALEKREYQILFADAWGSLYWSMSIQGETGEAVAALRNALPAREKPAAAALPDLDEALAASAASAGHSLERKQTET
jgi:hypothetical protein